jgi:hypothetical protein
MAATLWRRNLGNIAHASRLPDRKELELLNAKTIVMAMIKHTVDGLSLPHDDTPNWLRTANATNRVENRPMVDCRVWIHCAPACGSRGTAEDGGGKRASGGNEMSGGDASGDDDEEDVGERTMARMMQREMAKGLVAMW